MQKSKDKRWYKTYLLIYLLAFVAFISSCKGQDNKKLREPTVEFSDNSAHKSQTPWVDPLFYIEGQLCQHVREIFQDKNGNVWFGTNVYDLMRYDGDTLEYFSEKIGFGGGRVTGIVEDKNGNVWFGTYGGLTKYDGTSFINYLEKDDPYINDIWSVVIDKKGEFWIGTNEGLRQFDGKAFSIFPLPKAKVQDTTTTFSIDRITKIIEDRNGTLWFGTDGFGICKYDGNNFTHLTKEDGLPDNNIHDIMEDSKGNIWIGTMFGGISLYDGNSFTNFSQDGVVDGIEVGGLYEDKNGSIWFAVENFGVYRYDGKSFTNFDKKDGLNTNGILSIYEDQEGRFWFGGWGGLFRFDGKSFMSVTKDGPWH